MDTYENLYKNALSRAINAKQNTESAVTIGILEEVFPELKESESEQIRKALVEMVHDTTGDELWVDYNVHKEEALAWLEKQSEQKPFDYENANIQQKDFAPKVEPKFKVGDYIERKDGLGCHVKIIFVGKNVYGCEKLIYPKDSSPFFELMFENQDEFKMSSDFQQKSAWSEEDEEMFDGIIADIQFSQKAHNHEVDQIVYEREIDWLKSLKERIGG